MKINLTGVKSTTSSPLKNAARPATAAAADAKAKPLDQNSKILFSNSLHYKVIMEGDTKRDIEQRVS